MHTICVNEFTRHHTGNKRLFLHGSDFMKNSCSNCALVSVRTLRAMVYVVFSLLILSSGLPQPACSQDSVVLSYDGTAGFNGPMWAAKDLRLFESNGLKSELILVSGSARAMAALVSDSIQFAQGSATAAVPVQMRGGDVVIIAAALNKFPFSLVARKDIKKPADLVGKKIGILNFGGSNDLAVQLALKEWNIPRPSVTILAAGSAPARLSAMVAGGLDATVLSPPENFVAAQMGLNVIAQFSDLKASFPQTVVSVRRSFLEKNRETVKKFLRAYSEAIYVFKSNKQKAMSVYAGRLKQQGANVIEEAYNYFAPKFSLPPRVDPEGMRIVIEQAAQREPEAKRGFRVEQFVDERITDELEREGFFKKLTEAGSRK
jgi:ABC-type nitrate/sulfonate/bicarbonate transport system substrate-binding protein